jgi:3-oxoacyl-[acyl-carrier-protein] synthase-3
MSSLFGVRLIGTGSALPRRVVSNDQLPAILDTSDQWIVSRTGIHERRICAPEETSATLGLKAARFALESSGLSPDDLDLIICATVTPDTLVPSTACVIQGGLGCTNVPAFDVNAACSGFIYSLAVASQFLQTGTCRNVLVVGSDTLSRVVDFTDRNTCILFGDGAGAVVVAADEGTDNGLAFRLHADGSRNDLIRLNGVGRRPPFAVAPGPPAPHPDDFLRMNGREVFKFAVQTICRSIRETLEASQLTAADIDLIIPHQVNQRILDSAFPQLGISLDKVVVNLDRYGNTSAASIPIALDEAVRSGRARTGDRALLIAFGAGLTWASAVLPVGVAQKVQLLAG